ncbi:MAG: hypothetical protein HQ596_07460 [Candidatus Saganbacteria bacterium]|nr:hypothetical protein [Candidatus Saganbacteria bacterium]
MVPKQLPEAEIKTMNNPVLIVLDNLDEKWEEKLPTKGKPALRYELLTFGISPPHTEIEIIDTKEISRMAEREARDYYLELIRELKDRLLFDNKSLSQLLSFKGRNLWWYLPIAEKNIWVDKLIHRLYAFLRLFYVCEQQTYDEILLFVKDDLLQQIIVEFAEKRGVKCVVKGKRGISLPLISKVFVFPIAYYLRAIKHFANLFLKLILLRWIRIKTEAKDLVGTTGFFSTYPLFWEKAFSPKANDVFFRTLPDELAKQEKVSHLICLNLSMKLFEKRAKLFDFIRGHRKIVILEQVLRPSDWLLLFDLKIFRRCFTALKNLFGLPVAHLKGIDISNFVREEFYKSATSAIFFQSRLMDRAFGRLPIKELKALVFRLEFQPFERAILYNTWGKTQSIGFQHSALGKNFLNYVFVRGELAKYWRDRANPMSMPLPDYIFVSGEIGLDYMQDAGFPKNRLALCGALRYSPLFEYLDEKKPKLELRQKRNQPIDKKIIFVAASPLLPETLSMLGDLLKAISLFDEPFHLLIKYHPNVSVVPDFRKKVEKLLDESQTKNTKLSYEFFKELPDFYDYVSLSDLILLTGGTTALEAMLLGVPAMVYSCSPQFSHNPLLEYPGAVFLVKDSKSMAAALRKLSQKDEIERIRSNWGKLIETMFGDISEAPAKRFASLLSDLGAV